MSDNGIDINIVAEGNKLVYEYTYKNIEKTEGIAESLDSALEEERDDMESRAKQIKSFIDTNELSVVIRCFDINKDLLIEKEFSAE